MLITAAISTRDRADSLGATLESFRRLEPVPHVDWELVVVDNGSSDRTRELLDSFDGSLPLRVFTEPRPGLSRSRNRAIREARGEVVAFTDDDCRVREDWLAALARGFRDDPGLDGLGGRIELYDSRDARITIRTERSPIPLESSGQLFGLIAGCNMAFRRRAFERVGLFDLRLGPGTPGMASDDVDFLYRCLKGGLRVEYRPDAVVFHAHGRRAPDQVEALERAYRMSRGAFYCKHVLRGDRDILKRSWWEVSGYLEAAAQATRRGEPVRPHTLPLWHVCLGAVRRLGPGVTR